jgi:hypothetical protein
MAGYMTFPSFRTPRGLVVLVVRIASTDCEYDGDRVIILRQHTPTLS